MPWWKSSSRNHILSSSSASPSTGGHRGSRRDVRFFPWSRRHPQPRLTRQRKLRHLSDVDIEELSLDDPAAVSLSTPISMSPSNLDAIPSRSVSSPMLLPRPLPLPDAAAASPYRDSASDRGLGFSHQNAIGFPLPSPLRASKRAEGDDGNGVAADPTSLVSAIIMQPSAGLEQGLQFRYLLPGTGGTIRVRQVAGTQIARYRVVPPKIDRRRLIEQEKERKKKRKKKKKKKRREKKTYRPRAVLTRAPSPLARHRCPRVADTLSPARRERSRRRAQMAVKGAEGFGIAGREATLVLRASWFNRSPCICAKEIAAIRVYDYRAFTSRISGF
ncbi:hypothetical protein BHM03_00045333 [Ensete ventricosum]|nr:hypothetical protein BHM03_00045333 [Ensete ventricosum]